MLQSRHLINIQFIDTQASDLYEGMVTETDAYTVLRIMVLPHVIR